MSVEENGVRYRARCTCILRAQQEAERERPGGFEPIGQVMAKVPALRALAEARTTALLSHHDRKLGNLLARHRGAANAVTIREIGERLWPQEWAVDAARRNVERRIKDSVRTLRRVGVKVGTKRTQLDGPAGIFLIETAAELRATVGPFLRQALDELKTVEALTGKGYYSLELEGQMKLEEAG